MIDIEAKLEYRLTDERIGSYTLSSNNTHLHIACYTGNIKTVEECLKTEIDVNARNSLGETALYIACNRGQVEIVKLLLNSPKTNVNDQIYYAGWDSNYASLYITISNIKSAYNIEENPYFKILKLLLRDKRIDCSNIFSDKNGSRSYLAEVIFFKDGSAIQKQLCKIFFETQFESYDNPVASYDSTLHYLLESRKDYLLESRMNYLLESRMNYLLKSIIEDDELIKYYLESPIVTISNKNRRLINDIGDNDLISSLNARANLKPKQEHPIALLMVMTVLLSDGYYKINDSSSSNSNLLNQNETQSIERFFKIVHKLPFDLQSILVNRILGSSKNFVPSFFFEKALKHFLRVEVQRDQQNNIAPELLPPVWTAKIQ